MHDRILYCIFSKGNATAISQATAPLAGSGFTVQGIQVEKGGKVIPHYLLNNVQLDMEPDGTGAQPEGRLFYFMTDNPAFLKLAYRLYHGLFEAFVFFRAAQATESYLMLDDIYERLLEEPFREEEGLYKPVYSNSMQKLPYGMDCPVLGMDRLTGSATPASHGARLSLLYKIGDAYALFNPAGDGMQVLSLDAESPTNMPESKNSLPNPESLLIYLGYDQEMLGQMTGHVRRIGQNRRYFTTNKQSLTEAFTAWAGVIMNACFFEKQLYGKFMDILGDSCEVLGKLFLLSFRLKMSEEPTEKKALIEALLDTALGSYLDANELYYVLFQATQPLFTDAGLRTEKIAALSATLRERVCAYYKSIYPLEFIEKSERDEQLVVVLSAQMLTIGHGPTKTALDRCYTLIHDLHKNVQLICTKEMLAPSGEIPFFMPDSPNEMAEYESIQGLTYKDVPIPFWQLSGVMPRPDGIAQILGYIQQAKPYYAVSIGSGIIPDIVDCIVPVITIGTVPSSIPNVNTTFKVIGRKLTPAEKAGMEKKGVPTQSIIESIFTSAFREQSHVYSRELLGLPSGCFLLLVVGGRLGQEVTEAFIHMFLRTVPAKTHMVFLGHYPQYSEACEANPEFGKHSTYLGVMEDVLAVNEVCDLYVNPTRTGGGTSAAEALYKGLPVVTMDFGDVAVGAGPDFHVASYEEMSDAILRYAHDREYYALMSRKAKERAAVLMDTSTHFSHIIHQAVQSPLFR